jgi:hypothetical protein
MKIPSKRIELGELGYPGYYIEMPRSVKEGFIQSFAATAAKSDQSDEAKAAAGREANVKILELVTDWNLDDDQGNPLPLFRTLDSYEQKVAILAEMPVDILVHLAQNLTGASVPEPVKDFSNRS